MANDKLELREELIASIEKVLAELYRKLPPMPEDFAEIEGQMDDDDIIGLPEGPDLLDDFPETYRWLEHGDDDSYDTISVFWFDNKFVPNQQPNHDLPYVIEISHEFGEVAVYRQGGNWKYISEFVPEFENINEGSTSNRIKGTAGLNLLQRIHGRLLELLGQ